MDFTKRKLLSLTELAGYASLISWIIAMGISPTPDPHQESRIKFYLAHVIFASIIFIVVFTLGTIYITIKWFLTIIILWFRKRGTE